MTFCLTFQDENEVQLKVVNALLRSTEKYASAFLVTEELKDSN